MTGKTEAGAGGVTLAPAAAAASASAAAPVTSVARKPRLAIFVATAGGLGYFPKAPGTLGSIGGIALAMAPMWVSIFALTLVVAAQQSGEALPFEWRFAHVDPMLAAQIALAVIVALAGVWAASRAEHYWNETDPQRVVIDEVSGQHIAIVLGCVLPVLGQATHPHTAGVPLAMVSLNSPVGWKYLLAGFILFRLFDIWKPFPARQAEALHGGWGIMADDWIAGIYAGLCVWLARSAGL